MRYFVVHVGDRCVGVFERRSSVAKALGVSESTVGFYMSPAYKRRRSGLKSDSHSVYIEVVEV